MRVLDSKRPQDQPAIESAPTIEDFYGEAAAAHFELVQAGLERLGIPYEIDPKLVRGLDYYRRTTFEYQAESLDSAQNAIGGGGRYDGLVEAVGGPPTPGIGLAMGLDRTLLACDDEGVFAADPVALDAFVVDVTGGLEAVDIRQLDTVDPFEGQHVARGQLPHDLRHAKALVLGGRLCHFRKGRRFQA